MATRAGPGGPAPVCRRGRAVAGLEQEPLEQVVAEWGVDHLGVELHPVHPPLRVLHRGYSITERPDGHIIRDAAETQPGDSVRIRLEKGNLEATITAATE